jgi:TRAP-type C4-dicarboxylate transport system substrate-binding protein
MLHAKSAYIPAVVFVACLAASAAVVCGSEPGIILKFATLAPDETAWALPIKKILIPLVEQETGGLVRIKVYWGGVMGDDGDILKKIRINQLMGAGFSAQGTTLAAPALAVLELPFLFDGYNELDFVKYTMFDTFDRILDADGFFLIAWVDQDFDQIYSQRPIARLEDFKGPRFASWYGVVEKKLFQALGATPVPVNVPELPSAVRQGVVDASIGPAMWVVATQLYSTARFVNPMKIRYSPGMLVLRRDVWDQYPAMAKYKKRLYELRAPLTEAYCTIIRANNERCLAAMLKYGVVKVDTDEKSMAEIRRASRRVWDELAGELYSRELLDEVVSRVEEYRSVNVDLWEFVNEKRKEVLQVWERIEGKPTTPDTLKEVLARCEEIQPLMRVLTNTAATRGLLSLAIMFLNSTARIAPNMEDGNWEVTATGESPELYARAVGGAPGADTGYRPDRASTGLAIPPVKMTFCSNKDNPDAPGQARSCRLTSHDIEGDQISLTVACDMGQGVSIEGSGHGTCRPAAFDGELSGRLKNPDGTVLTIKGRLSGRRLGPCAK